MSSSPIDGAELVDELQGDGSAPDVARELEARAAATGRVAEFVEQLADADVEEIVELRPRLLGTPPTEPDRVEVRLDVVLPIEPDPPAAAHTIVGDGTIPREAEAEIEYRDDVDDRSNLDRLQDDLEERAEERRATLDPPGILGEIEQEVDAATPDVDDDRGGSCETEGCEHDAQSESEHCAFCRPREAIADDQEDVDEADQEASDDVEDPAPELAESLPATEEALVSVLADAGEATTEELTDRLHVSRATVHSYLSTLRDRDLVAQRRDPRDGRRKIYRLASVEAPDEGVLEEHPADVDVEEEIDALEELVDESDQESDAVAHEESEDVDEGSAPPQRLGRRRDARVARRGELSRGRRGVVRDPRARRDARLARARAARGGRRGDRRRRSDRRAGAGGGSA